MQPAPLRRGGKQRPGITALRGDRREDKNPAELRAVHGGAAHVDPPRPTADRRLVPRWFLPLHLSSKYPVQNATCTATSRAVCVTTSSAALVGSSASIPAYRAIPVVRRGGISLCVAAREPRPPPLCTKTCGRMGIFLSGLIEDCREEGLWSLNGKKKKKMLGCFER